jgi:2-desacetyl-2-hydroxyethyl bacteriochlorophyllide A dehydrogenase
LRAVKARALWHVAPGRAELREEVLRPPGPGEVLVRTLFSGISRGTERLVHHGRVPESQWGAMRGPGQAGDFPFPVKYGYCAVGVVEAGVEDWIGQRVFCLHPHQDLFVVPLSLCAPLPVSVPHRRAVLAANMETALNAMWDARPLMGERVLVVGAGVVGLLSALLAAAVPGVQVEVCDIDPRKAEVAEALGLEFQLPTGAMRDCDLVIHASATPEGLWLALDRCGFEGRVVEASWYGDRQVELPLGEAFHARRLSIVSSQVGHIAPAMRGRRTHADRMMTATGLLEDRRLDALLGPEVPFKALAGEIGGLLEGSGLCPVVSYLAAAPKEFVAHPDPDSR